MAQARRKYGGYLGVGTGSVAKASGGIIEMKNHTDGFGKNQGDTAKRPNGDGKRRAKKGIVCPGPGLNTGIQMMLSGPLHRRPDHEVYTHSPYHHRMHGTGAGGISHEYGPSAA